MKTGNNKATNNFIIRFWSKKHYNDEVGAKQFENIYRGTITNAQTKEEQHFHNAGEFLSILEKEYWKSEELK